ncbi:MAG TPA: hypothetical protein VHX59_13110 [Mycobacteriales bacterium]|nr:hypothetical protein [Mycobacteriales bacterium]
MATRDTAAEENEQTPRRRPTPRPSVAPGGGRPRVAGQRNRTRPAADEAAVGEAPVDETGDAAGDIADDAADDIAGDEAGDAARNEAGDAATSAERTHRAIRLPRMRLPRPRSGSRRTWLSVSAVLLVVFAVTAAVLGLRLYDGRASDANSADVLRIVPRYASQVLSFDYRHLDTNAAAARPLLSGSYRKDYDQSMTSHAAAWKKYHYVVKSSIASAGVSQASGSQVVVVAFVDQSVSAGTTKIGTAKDLIRLRLTLQRQHGSWLLIKLGSL